MLKYYVYDFDVDSMEGPYSFKMAVAKRELYGGNRVIMQIVVNEEGKLVETRKN